MNRALVPIALAGALLGCAHVQPRKFEWVRGDGHVPIQKKILISRLADRRPMKREDLEKIAWLPFVPFGTTIQHRPWPGDVGGDPTTAFPRILAAELKDAQIFRDVGLQMPTRRKPWAIPHPGLLLEGEVRSARVEVRFLTYGHSIAALPLWILGAPIRSYVLVLDLHLEVLEAGTRDVLWSMDIQETWKQWQGIYYGRNYYHFPELMSRAALRAALDMDRAAGRGAFGGSGQ